MKGKQELKEVKGKEKGGGWWQHAYPGVISVHRTQHPFRGSVASVILSVLHSSSYVSRLLSTLVVSQANNMKLPAQILWQ